MEETKHNIIEKINNGTEVSGIVVSSNRSKVFPRQWKVIAFYFVWKWAQLFFIAVRLSKTNNASTYSLSFLWAYQHDGDIEKLIASSSSSLSTLYWRHWCHHPWKILNVAYLKIGKKGTYMYYLPMKKKQSECIKKRSFFWSYVVKCTI